MAKNNPQTAKTDAPDMDAPDGVDDLGIEQLQNELTQCYAVIDQLRAENAELNNQIDALKAKLDGAPKIKAVGHLLEPGDPFAAGSLRTYLKLRPESSQPKTLPFVLPYNDPASITALNDYRLRAAAAGDTGRVAAADAALAKCVK